MKAKGVMNEELVTLLPNTGCSQRAPAQMSYFPFQWQQESLSEHLMISQDMGPSDGIGLQACPSLVNMFIFLYIVKLLSP